jgi:hypothetical protein
LPSCRGVEKKYFLGKGNTGAHLTTLGNLVIALLTKTHSREE